MCTIAFLIALKYVWFPTNHIGPPMWCQLWPKLCNFNLEHLLIPHCYYYSNILNWVKSQYSFTKKSTHLFSLTVSLHCFKVHGAKWFSQYQSPKSENNANVFMMINIGLEGKCHSHDSWLQNIYNNIYIEACHFPVKYTVTMPMDLYTTSHHSA